MNSKKMIFGLLTLVTIYSCNNDDNTNSETLPNLINKWNLETWKYNNNNQSLTSCDKQGYIKFNNNGTFERKDYYNNNGNCEIEGNDNGTYTYDTSNNKITLNYTDVNDGPQTEVLNNVSFTITKLNYTWDEDNNGSDEHFLEFLKN